MAWPDHASAPPNSKPETGPRPAPGVFRGPVPAIRHEGNGTRGSDSVDGHQDLPSDGHEVGSTAITESNRIRWSLRREICSCRLFASLRGWPSLPIKHRSACWGRPQRYPLPAESCGTAAVSPVAIMGRDGPARDPGAGRVVCHGQAVRMSPGLVMAGTGGNPGSPRCWTYEPGFIPGRDRTESVMENSQRAGSGDDRAGTGRVRRWWTGDKLSVRLSEVAFVLVLAGALVWDGWFASASQNATWSAVLIITIAAGTAARRRSRMSRSR